MLRLVAIFALAPLVLLGIACGSPDETGGQQNVSTEATRIEANYDWDDVWSIKETTTHPRWHVIGIADSIVSAYYYNNEDDGGYLDFRKAENPYGYYFSDEPLVLLHKFFEDHNHTSAPEDPLIIE